MSKEVKKAVSKEKIKDVDLDVSKKLTRKERKKLREKKKAKQGFPTKMNKYLWFVIIFAGIVTSFDGWCTIALTLAMSSYEGVSFWNIFQYWIDPDIFGYFGLSSSPVMMGVILSIGGVGVVAATSFKFLVDKFGRRPLTLITSVGFITFTFLTSFTPPGPRGLVIFLILRILSTYFLSGDIVTIIMAEESPINFRGRLIGIVLLCNAFGGVACAFIQMLGIRAEIPGPWGFVMTSWQSLFFFPVIGYVFIIPLFFFLRETKRFEAMKNYENWRKKKGLKSKVGWFAPLQKKYARGMAIGIIGGFCGNLISFAQATFFGIYFRQELNMSMELIGLAALPVAAAGGLGFLVAVPLLDRWGRMARVRRFSYLTFAGGLLFSCPAVFVQGNETNPFIISLVVFGGVLAAFSIVVSLLGFVILPMELMPTHIRSTAMGWISAVSRGAMIFAPFFMMFGAESVGGLGLSYQFMFALMGMFLTVLLYCCFLLGTESKKRELEELVVSEVYTKKKKQTHDRKYMEKYYLFIIELILFLIFGNVYGLTSDGSALSVFFMVGFYGLLAFAFFLIMVYVREKIM